MSEAGLAETKLTNAQGLYPPLFYAAMSVFASADLEVSVITMRLANSAIAVGMLTSVFFALPRNIRPALVLSALCTTVPLGVFLIPSTNPSSWAITSALTVWVSLFGAARTASSSRRAVLSALAVIGAVLGAGARADAALYAVVAVVLVGIMTARSRRTLIVPAAAAVIIVVIAIVFYTGAGQAGAIGGLGGKEQDLTAGDHVENFLGVPLLWLGVFGYTGLGWLDTPMPPAVWVLGFGVFAAALGVGLRRVSFRRSLALGLSFAAIWLLPFVVIVRSRVMVEDFWIQPRYILPLIIMLAGIATVGVPRGQWSGPRFNVSAVALAASMVVSLNLNIRRYTTGFGASTVDPGAGAEWWWCAGPAPLTVWLAGSAAFAVALVFIGSLNRGGALLDPHPASEEIPPFAEEPARMKNDAVGPTSLTRRSSGVDFGSADELHQAASDPLPAPGPTP